MNDSAAASSLMVVPRSPVLDVCPVNYSENAVYDEITEPLNGGGAIFWAEKFLHDYKLPLFFSLWPFLILVWDPRALVRAFKVIILALVRHYGLWLMSIYQDLTNDLTFIYHLLIVILFFVRFITKRMRYLDCRGTGRTPGSVPSCGLHRFCRQGWPMRNLSRYCGFNLRASSLF